MESNTKGCMNCGNISCGNNKKRESAGCGRWKTPEQKIIELEEENSELREKNEGFQRACLRMKDMGFPTFASVKEYAAKLLELEKENTKLKEFVNAPHTKGRKTTRGDYIKTVWDLSKQLTKAKEIIKNLLSAYTTYADSFDDRDNEIVEKAEQFLNSEPQSKWINPARTTNDNEIKIK